MLQTSVLLSGSKGNATIVFTNDTCLLLDAGLSAKKIFTAMESLGLNPRNLNGILVSHEHSDHVRGAGIISRKLNIPIYFTEQTYSSCSNKIGKLKQSPEYFFSGEKFVIRDIEVTSFKSTHDAIDSCNFLFQQINNQDQKLAVATDLGYSTKLLLEMLKNSTTIVLESNHDEVALLNGPYPWELKQRVKSNHGHLSNKQAVAVVSQIMHPGLSNLVLAHLSEENNTPQLARSEMENYLHEIKAETKLFIADQYKPTPIIKV